MTLNINNIPLEMTRFKQWVFWKSVKLPNNEKPSKIPYKSTAETAKTNDPATWLSFDQVKCWQQIGMSGIGFVLTKHDPFTIIDLDKCIQDHKTTDFSRKVVRFFNSYTEVSPSGTGLHVIVTGNIPKAIKKVEIEIYSDLRYMAMTGEIFLNKPIAECQAKLDKVFAKYNPPVEQKPVHNYHRNFHNSKFKMPTAFFAEGERNNSLARWAGILRKKAITESEYFQYLQEINRRCCNPPLPENEVIHVGNSIKRYR